MSCRLPLAFSALAVALAAGSAHAQTWTDNFNRADGPIGGSWNITSGTWAVQSYHGRHTSGGGDEILTHSLATMPYTSAVTSLDVFSTTVSQYSGVVIGLGGTDSILVKVQDQNLVTPGFSHIAFYHQLSPGFWTAWTGTTTAPGGGTMPDAFITLPSGSEFTAARMTVSFDSADVVRLEIDTDFDGAPEMVYTRSGVSAFAGNLGGRYGIAAWGSTATFDNWSVSNTGRWTPAAAAPEARSRAAGALIGDLFYFMGGESSTGRSTACWKLNIPTNTWSPIASMPGVGTGGSGVSNVDAAAIGTDIYLVGGYDGTTAYARLLKYNTLTNTWSEIATDPCPSPLYGASSVAYNNKLYVIGGSDGSALSSHTYIYNPGAAAGSRWTTAAGMAAPRQFAGAVALSDRIYVAGGIPIASSPEFNSAEVFNPATNTWSAAGTMSAARGGPGMYNLYGRPYAVAGGWTTHLTSAEVYDNGAWVPGRSVNSGVRTFAYDGNSQWLVKAGGYDTNFSSSVEVLSIPPFTCYANCDGSVIAPILNVNDFICFQLKFAAADLYANCDGSTTPPVLNVNDFICFQLKFADGCVLP